MRAPLFGIILLLSAALAVTGYLFSDATIAIFNSVTSTLSNVAYYSFFYVLVPGFLLFLLFLSPPMFLIVLSAIGFVAAFIHWDSIVYATVAFTTKAFYYVVLPGAALWISFLIIKNTAKGENTKSHRSESEYKASNATSGGQYRQQRTEDTTNSQAHAVKKIHFHDLPSSPIAPPEKALLRILHEAASADQIRQANRLLANFKIFNVATNLNPALVEAAEVCNYFIANDDGMGNSDVKYIIESLYLASACDACMSKIFRDKDSLRRGISMGFEAEEKASYLKRELIPRFRHEASKFDRSLEFFETIDLTDISRVNKDLVDMLERWIDYGIGIKPFTYDYDLCLEFIGDNAVDNMSGTEYENFVAKKFVSFGYEAMVTKGSNDYGIDIIANKDGHKIAVQCKRYATPVGFASVQQAFTGKAIYDCDSAFVISNATFTPSAKKAAEQLGVHLTHHSNIEKAVRKAIGAVNV